MSIYQIIDTSIYIYIYNLKLYNYIYIYIIIYIYIYTISYYYIFDLSFDHLKATISTDKFSPTNFRMPHGAQVRVPLRLQRLAAFLALPGAAAVAAAGAARKLRRDPCADAGDAWVKTW